ncbi:MAG: hypothetical protein C5B47_08150 [Verrucomicrobia bacterium]|nr:MAG: hypothetical protein C5B47_08150 [Verrucomicrobiota bacterium]
MGRLFLRNLHLRALSKGLILILMLFLYAPLLFASPTIAPPPATVYYTGESEAMDPIQGVRPQIVQSMVDRLLLAMTGRSSIAEAWGSLVKPSDRIGIKVSASGGAISGTHPAVVEAIARGLIAAGVPRNHILVWDRNLEDLIAAGYSTKSPYYVLQWIDSADGYDMQTMVSSPVVGRLVWGDSRFGKRPGSRLVDLLAGGEQLSSESFYTKILTREVDKVINVPSLLDSYLTGIQGALVNMTLQNIDNWRRFTKESGASYIAEIYADEAIRPKVLLTILDALVLQFAGGPFPNPGYTAIKNNLFLSRDPVAIDATAIRMIDEFRVSNRLPKCAELASYVQVASQMGIGQADEKNIILKGVFK